MRHITVMLGSSGNRSTEIFKGLLPTVIFILSIFFDGVAKADTLSVGVTPANFTKITSILDISGKDPAIISRDDCPDLQSEKLINAGRPVVELFIVCNAIFEANLADQILLIHHLPHRRRLNEIAAGNIDVSGSSIFPEAAETLTASSPLLISQAVIEVNEFEKAIFTLPGRDDVLAVRSLDELRKFKAVIVKYWVVDVKTLKAMKLKGVVEVTKPDLYTKFLEVGRADFLISEFSTLSSMTWGNKLVRIPGVKVSLISPRIFLVSPKRNDILQAINAFLEKARAGGNDLVKQALQKAGFFRPEFSDWKLLFPTN